MARAIGQRLPNVVRRKGVRMIQQLLAAGVEEAECCEQVAERFNVSERTCRSWLALGYDGLAKEVETPRNQLLGLALKRRRIAMARAAKDGDWKTYLAAADSEAKLLGLNAPVETVNHLVVEKVGTMSKAMVDVIKDFFAGDPDGQARFVGMLRTRLNASLEERPKPVTIEIGMDDGGPALADAGTDGTVVDASIEDSPDVAPPADRAVDAPPPA